MKKLNFTRKELLALIVFLSVLFLISYYGYFFMKQMNNAYYVNDFKKRAIQGVIIDSVSIQSVRTKRFFKAGWLVQPFGSKKQPEAVSYLVGCDAINFTQKGRIGDTVFKQKDTFLIHLKNASRDTFLNQE